MQSFSYRKGIQLAAKSDIAKIATIPYLVTNAALIRECFVGFIKTLNRRLSVAYKCK